MKIKKILIFAVEIILLILTIIQLMTIRDLRLTYQKACANYTEKIEEKEPEIIIVKVEYKNDEKEISTGETKEKNNTKKSLIGNFKLTAYCSCYECCEKYAMDRPVDENGNKIVYGAIGEKLVEGYSIAVDPKVIPYGTEVIIEGVTYKAQDCGGAINGNISLIQNSIFTQKSAGICDSVQRCLFERVKMNKYVTLLKMRSGQ